MNLEASRDRRTFARCSLRVGWALYTRSRQVAIAALACLFASAALFASPPTRAADANAPVPFASAVEEEEASRARWER